MQCRGIMVWMRCTAADRSLVRYGHNMDPATNMLQTYCHRQTMAVGLP